MKNIRVEVSDEVTVNLGNFQNEKPGYKISASVEDNENPNQVRAKLKKVIDGWLEEDIKELIQSKRL